MSVLYHEMTRVGYLEFPKILLLENVSPSVRPLPVSENPHMRYLDQLLHTFYFDILQHWYTKR